MLELLRRRSAAGEAPSPSEDAASTVTAPATQPATSPKGVGGKWRRRWDACRQADSGRSG